MPRRLPEVDPELDKILFNELAPAAETLLEAHTSRPKDYYPHQEVPPYINVGMDPTEPWSEDTYPLEPAVRSALFVNLLTEDNLPYYTHEILGIHDPEHPFSVWGRLWTAEESRHSDIIRRWVEATHALDPVKLQDGHMVQLQSGQVPHSQSFAELIAYTSFQELATKVAHANTANRLGPTVAGKAGRRVLRIVAGDEMRHYNFYSGMVSAALDVDPSTMMLAIQRQLSSFKMPGTGIPDFDTHSKAIAEGDIYSVKHFLHDVVERALEKWHLDEIEGITDEAKVARDGIHRHLKTLARAERMLADRQASST